MSLENVPLIVGIVINLLFFSIFRRLSWAWRIAPFPIAGAMFAITYFLVHGPIRDGIFACLFFTAVLMPFLGVCMFFENWAGVHEELAVLMACVFFFSLLIAVVLWVFGRPAGALKSVGVAGSVIPVGIVWRTFRSRRIARRQS